MENALTVATEVVVEPFAQDHNEIEGVMKDHVYKNGEFIDVTIMGITSDRWDQIKQNFHYNKVVFED